MLLPVKVKQFNRQKITRLVLTIFSTKFTKQVKHFTGNNV